MAEEFVCCECGRRIIAVPGDVMGYRMCNACMAIPGWHLDPELRRRLDPDYEPPA